MSNSWRIDSKGMELPRRGYWIASDRYDERRLEDNSLSAWPLHIAGKERGAFDLEDFIDAFHRAILMAGINVGFDWDKSIAAARDRRAHAIEFDRVHKELFPKSRTTVFVDFREWEAVEAELQRRAGHQQHYAGHGLARP